MKSWHLLAIAAGLFVVSPAQAVAQSINGPAQAVDGDTLVFTGVRVRLAGIDALELKQACDRNGAQWTCGQEAKSALARLVADKFVTCVGNEHDAYGRLVAKCRVEGVDLGESMVSAGLATAFTQYSDDYVDAEARAKQAKLGIWASRFDIPSDWRQAHNAREPVLEHGASASAPAKPASYRDAGGRCVIKGNHSRKGEWIYHLPGQAYYDQTRAEAIFCTEEAAQRAGYRPSKV